MTSYRLFPATNGPATSASFSGSYIAGMAFKVTQPTMYLEGYWWWVCPDNVQSKAAQKFTLWQTSTTSAGVLVPEGTVTSGALSNGWNYVQLPAPVPLNPSTAYEAATGLTNNFPFTGAQFSTGGPYVNGITSGPLFAYSSTTGDGGTAPPPWGNAQASFSTASSDPAVQYPNTGSSGFNSWLDVQVTDVPPPGASYRLWSSLPSPSNQGGVLPAAAADTAGYTMALEFSLSKACTLGKIWWFSASGSLALPARCAIWDVAGQTVVTGTDNAAPAWKKPDGTAAAAAAGWVYCDYSLAGVTLNSSQNYKASVWYGGGTKWRSAANPYFAAGGDGVNGWSAGPITAPNAANATPGQNSWNSPGWAYPNTFSNPENDWVDIEVTPVPPPAGPAVATSSPAVTARDTSAPAVAATYSSVPAVTAAATSSPAVR